MQLLRRVRTVHRDLHQHEPTREDIQAQQPHRLVQKREYRRGGDGVGDIGT